MFGKYRYHTHVKCGVMHNITWLEIKYLGVFGNRIYNISKKQSVYHSPKPIAIRLQYRIPRIRNGNGVMEVPVGKEVHIRRCSKAV